MTIQNTTIRKAGPSQGNGVTTVFPFTFKVFTSADILVTYLNASSVESVLVLTTNYTVSLNADQNTSPGGSVTLLVAPATGTYITLTSQVTNTQNLALTNSGGFYPESINDALDRTVIQVQQLAEIASRSVTAPVSSTIDPAALISSLQTASNNSVSAWESFESVYYGDYASAPTTNPLGAASAYGDMYYNTSLQSLQIYTSSGWTATAQATPVSYSSQLLSGTGAQTAFTLSSAPATIIATEVFISGVRQRPTTDYTLSGTTLTFLSAPASGTNNIFVRWTYAIAVGVPNDGSVTTAKFASGAKAPLAVTADSANALNTTAQSKIFSISASVASNALTCTLNPTTLDFRNTPLTSGTINTRTVATAISLVVPSTATLGTVSAQQSRLILLALDNAGTIELAIVNIAGGNNLDETTLISTTAIAAGSNTANVVYSTTARTSLPFRVVGYVESTQATAGTWATAPSTIQGQGGQALAAMSSIGYGQTWQNVTSSRVLGTTYYNTTGKPILINCRTTITATTSVLAATVNGVIASDTQGNSTYEAYKSVQGVIVPAGGSYLFSLTVGTGALIYWAELR